MVGVVASCDQFFARRASCHKIVLLAGGLLTSAVMTPAVVGHAHRRALFSAFERGTDGWTVVNVDSSANATRDYPWMWPYWSRKGNPGACVAAVDAHRGKIWGWQAPAAFLGRQSARYGTFLTFDICATEVDRRKLPVWNLRLVGRVAGEYRVLFIDDLPQPKSNCWTSYSVLLDTKGGWKRFVERGAPTLDATEEDIRAVLANLVNLWIQGEFSSRRGMGFLDNVVLGDRPPQLNVMDVWQKEDNGKGVFHFVARLKNNRGQSVHTSYPVDVTCQSHDGSAISPYDYKALPKLTLHFPPGQPAAIVSIPVVRDTVDEPNERFTLEFTHPINAELSNRKVTGVIFNDDSHARRRSDAITPMRTAVRKTTRGRQRPPEGAGRERVVRVRSAQREQTVDARHQGSP